MTTNFIIIKQNIQGTREKFENVLSLGKSATINVLNEMIERDIIETDITLYAGWEKISE